jgi:hypothetical protein
MSDSDISNLVYCSRVIKRIKVSSYKMPQSIAAGCIYLYVCEKKLKKINVTMISNYCVVSVLTTKSTKSELAKYKEHIIPNEDSNLIDGVGGNCVPSVKIQKLYIAPSNLPEIILEEEPMHSEKYRGRPKTK